MHYCILSLPNELFYQVISVKVIYTSELFWTIEDISLPDKDLSYQLKLQGLSLWLLYHYQGSKNINCLLLYINWPQNVCPCRSKWPTLPAAGALSTFLVIWVRSRNRGCLVTWFCYQLIAKPGNKTATVSWPDPYEYFIISPSAGLW